MMKFDIKTTDCGYFLHNGPSGDDMIYFGGYGGIRLYKENKKSKSYSIDDNDYFNYQGIQNALVPNSYNNSGNFTPQRITVIQMK